MGASVRGTGLGRLLYCVVASALELRHLLALPAAETCRDERDASAFGTEGRFPAAPRECGSQKSEGLSSQIEASSSWPRWRASTPQGC